MKTSISEILKKFRKKDDLNNNPNFKENTKLKIKNILNNIDENFPKIKNHLDLILSFGFILGKFGINFKLYEYVSRFSGIELLNADFCPVVNFVFEITQEDEEEIEFLKSNEGKRVLQVLKLFFLKKNMSISDIDFLICLPIAILSWHNFEVERESNISNAWNSKNKKNSDINIFINLNLMRKEYAEFREKLCWIFNVKHIDSFEEKPMLNIIPQINEMIEERGETALGLLIRPNIIKNIVYDALKNSQERFSFIKFFTLEYYTNFEFMEAIDNNQDISEQLRISLIKKIINEFYDSVVKSGKFKATSSRYLARIQELTKTENIMPYIQSQKDFYSIKKSNYNIISIYSENKNIFIYENSFNIDTFFAESEKKTNMEWTSMNIVSVINKINSSYYDSNLEFCLTCDFDIKKIIIKIFDISMTFDM